MDMFPRT